MDFSFHKNLNFVPAVRVTEENLILFCIIFLISMVLKCSLYLSLFFFLFSFLITHTETYLRVAYT